MSSERSAVESINQRLMKARGAGWVEVAEELVASAKLPEWVQVELDGGRRVVELRWSDHSSIHAVTSRFTDVLGASPNYQSTERRDGQGWQYDAWYCLEVHTLRRIGATARGMAGLCAVLAGSCTCEDPYHDAAEAPFLAYEHALGSETPEALTSHSQLVQLDLVAGGGVLSAAELLGSLMEASSAESARGVACGLGHLSGLLAAARALA